MKFASRDDRMTGLNFNYLDKNLNLSRHKFDLLCIEFEMRRLGLT